MSQSTDSTPSSRPVAGSTPLKHSMHTMTQPVQVINLAALDALREAVKGCGVIGRGGVRCCFYWTNLGLYEPCSRACREQLHRALHALLGDVKLTPHRDRPDDWSDQ